MPRLSSPSYSSESFPLSHQHHSLDWLFTQGLGWFRSILPMYFDGTTRDTGSVDIIFCRCTHPKSLPKKENDYNYDTVQREMSCRNTSPMQTLFLISPKCTICKKKKKSHTSVAFTEHVCNPVNINDTMRACSDEMKFIYTQQLCSQHTICEEIALLTYRRPLYLQGRASLDSIHYIQIPHLMSWHKPYNGKRDTLLRTTIVGIQIHSSGANYTLWLRV